MLEYIK